MTATSLDKPLSSVPKMAVVPYYIHVQQTPSPTVHLPCSSRDILGNVDISRGLTGIFSSLDNSFFSTGSVRDNGGKVDLFIGGSEPPPNELPKL